ncbi:spindle pole body component 110 [Pyrus ussuriensis x Pyrus communis]|uniref:Spindle pole body component 110 n=1 Tax=Pyrus ussuriensis x Pyrus communis TaxID=2448454 RepID=A0A5N5HLN0_9ROSA|nr:spindle pole body component 110 [Pyrus ussuriensis x Pyrus communis]
MDDNPNPTRPPPPPKESPISLYTMVVACLQPVDVINTQFRLNQTGTYKGIVHCVYMCDGMGWGCSDCAAYWTLIKGLEIWILSPCVDACPRSEASMLRRSKTAASESAEVSMNEQALRKFVEENQRLASECAHLVTQCNKWERECSLYDHDREDLMDFGKEADQRAKEAKIRVLEDEVRELRDELALFKYKKEMHSVKLLFEENKVLDVENKRLLRLYQKERNHSASDGKHTDSASAKMGQRENNSFDSFILCVGLL